MKILVTGASGLLGLNLALDARASHEVIGVDRSKLSRVPFQLIHTDLLTPGALERVLEESQPEALIHCAALANVDACEADPESARHLNADLPGELAAACAQRGIRLIHISTDAVFDGTQETAYSEQDQPNPLSVYAKTKLQGERAVLAANPQALVARVNFYGWSLSGRRSLAEFFVNSLSAGKRLNGFTDIWFCPCFVGDLGDTLLKMLEQELSGLYHVVGVECMTKYEFGMAVADKFEFDPGLIQPVSVEQGGLSARRSHNLCLSVHKLTTDLGGVLPGFSAGLERFYTQHQQGYPLKIRSYQQASQ